MGKRKERSGIVFLIEQMTLAEALLDDWELGRLYRALKAYSTDRLLPDSTTQTKQWNAVFKMMRTAQDQAIAKYEELCERNQRIARDRTQRMLKGDEALRNVTELTNIIKNNQIKKSQINACGGPVPALDGQEGVTDDECEDIHWL